MSGIRWRETHGNKYSGSQWQRRRERKLRIERQHIDGIDQERVVGTNRARGSSLERGRKKRQVYIAFYRAYSIADSEAQDSRRPPVLSIYRFTDITYHP
ncbi:BgTH12-01658 [Blumeria graminis f. sp. triticale]|uniref:BgTH12-01658 n=1 Tax=Blumeria graminis f. sp. triticale TaxID=1689686 RepID=A0A9W4CZL3_BLUGR|nr:BgTH12-01658 [Blumeria graminis f. sp. triticale]